MDRDAQTDNISVWWQTCADWKPFFLCVFINYCVSLSALQTCFIKHIWFLHLEAEQHGWMYLPPLSVCIKGEWFVQTNPVSHMDLTVMKHESSPSFSSCESEWSGGWQSCRWSSFVCLNIFCVNKLDGDLDIEGNKKLYPTVDILSCNGLGLSNYTSASSVQFHL